MWRKISIALIMVLVLFLGYKVINAINNKQQIKEAIATLPAFKFYTLQNKPYTKDSLLQNQSTLFLFFNSTCEHCQYETEQILKVAGQLSNKNVLYISSQSIREIKAFDSIYHLTNYPFIKLLRDSTNNFYKTFGTSMVPSSVIYNDKGMLMKTFKGEVKIEAIINALN
jgi:thiol-disulfide isomerase/thioredoxin